MYVCQFFRIRPRMQPSVETRKGTLVGLSVFFYSICLFLVFSLCEVVCIFSTLD